MVCHLEGICSSSPFLDVLVTRDEHRLSTSEHHKPTHTDGYIPYNSHDHPRVLTGVRDMYACGTELSKYAMQPANRQRWNTWRKFSMPMGSQKDCSKELSCVNPGPPPRCPPREDDDPEEETPKLYTMCPLCQRCERKARESLRVRVVTKPQKA